MAIFAIIAGVALLYSWLLGHWFARVLTFLVLAPVLGGVGALLGADVYAYSRAPVSPPSIQAEQQPVVKPSPNAADVAYAKSMKETLGSSLSQAEREDRAQVASGEAIFQAMTSPAALAEAARQMAANTRAGDGRTFVEWGLGIAGAAVAWVIRARQPEVDSLVMSACG